MNRLLSRSRIRRRLERWFGCDEGQGQIEFVLSILTIMFTIFWTWEVVLAVYTYNVLSDAAKEGVRYAIVHGSNNEYCSGPNAGTSTDGQCQNTGTAPQIPTPPSCGMAAAVGTDSGTTPANIKSVVTCYAQLSLHDISAISITVGYPDNSNVAPSRVNVTVSYKYVPFLALPITPTLQTAASGRIVN